MVLQVAKELQDICLDVALCVYVVMVCRSVCRSVGQSMMMLQVEKELQDICSDVLGVLDKHLVPSAATGESKVFYCKM